jgi:AcrR family transcriptional regulator
MIILVWKMGFMATDTRQRMIQTTAQLLRSKGPAAMSFTEVVQQSGAPRGVIYHHFPEGKAELIDEAVRWTGLNVAAQLEILRDENPMQVVDDFLMAIRHVLAESVDGCSCAIASVTSESTPSSSLAGRADAVLQSWIDLLVGKFLRSGVDEEVAQSVGVLLIAVLQGLHVLSRAAGSLDSFDLLAGPLRTAIASLLAPA